MFREIFADPSKDTPAIVRAEASFVAVAAFPEQAAEVPELVIYPAPFVIALLFSDIFAVPLNETPAIVLAVCNRVAVAAFPVQEPDEPVVFWLSVGTFDATIIPLPLITVAPSTFTPPSALKTPAV